MYANQTLHPLHVGPKPVPAPGNEVDDPNEGKVAQISETITDTETQIAAPYNLRIDWTDNPLIVTTIPICSTIEQILSSDRAVVPLAVEADPPTMGVKRR